MGSPSEPARIRIPAGKPEERRPVALLRGRKSAPDRETGPRARHRWGRYLRAALVFSAVSLLVLPSLAAPPPPRWAPPSPRAATHHPVPPPPRAALAPQPAPRAATVAGICGWASAPSTYQHVIWIWFENKSLSEVVGSSNAPYITSLARTDCAYGTSWVDNILDTPSLPQYVAATAGANCDSGRLRTSTPSGDRCVTNNDAPASACSDVKCPGTIGIMSIFEQLQNAGKSWRAYAESMPANCSTANPSGSYYVKHNPAPYFSRLRIANQFDGNTCSKQDVSFPTTKCNGTSCTVAASPNRLADDLAKDALSTFSFVTPNICNDMHDTCSGYGSSVANGDDWLAAWMPKITDSPGYQAGTTAVFVMWDEGSFGGAIPNVVVAPSVTPGTVTGSTINNIGALRATESMLGLAWLNCARGKQADGSSCPAGSTANLRSLFGI
jgi:hypothetical protein